MKFIHIMDKEYREMELQGWTYEKIAETLGWSMIKVSCILNGDVQEGFLKLKPNEVYALLEIFGYNKRNALNILVYINKLCALMNDFNRSNI